jgi:iron(III) transport system substrate-binding protein
MKIVWTIVTVLILVVGSAAAQSFPDPKDEAKLYELAKKEGKVVWYVSAPLEPMKMMATEFEKTYPGIKVDTLRIVGPQERNRG